MKKPILACLLVSLAIFLAWYLFSVINNKKTKEYKGGCINYQEKQSFEKPIPIVWTAKFDGCLVGCWGAVFTRVPADPQFPRFSGYVPNNGDRIVDEFMKEGQILKISGNWIDVFDSYGSVFNNMCIATVEINKIEILNEN